MSEVSWSKPPNDGPMLSAYNNVVLTYAGPWGDYTISIAQHNYKLMNENMSMIAFDKHKNIVAEDEFGYTLESFLKALNGIKETLDAV